jgi:hypothetical protein
MLVNGINIQLTYLIVLLEYFIVLIAYLCIRNDRVETPSILSVLYETFIPPFTLKYNHV